MGAVHYQRNQSERVAVERDYIVRGQEIIIVDEFTGKPCKADDGRMVYIKPWKLKKA